MILDDISAYLVAQNLVVPASAINSQLPPGSWPMYSGYVPDDFDQTVALFETPGRPALTMLREVGELSFQLRVRGLRLNYLATRSKWQACFTALQDSQPTPAYALVQAMHYGPMMFNDDRGRTNFISNFRAILLTSAMP